MSLYKNDLLKTIEEFHQINKVQKHFMSLEVQLEDAYNTMDKLGKLLDDKYGNFENMEGKSVKGLFYKVLGSKEEQTEKARQDYLDAALKYQEAKKEVDLLEFEKNLLKDKLEQRVGIEHKIKTLMQKRELELKRSDPKVASKLRAIGAEQENLQRVKVDIREALDAAEKAMANLQRMIMELKKASDWGQWDMYGGATNASYNKHSHIDRARELSLTVKHNLIRFEEELSDVYETGKMELQFQLEPFNRFTDVFFDNLISDWIIQQKINNALNNVVSIHDKVKRYYGSLKTDFPRVDQELDALEEERKQLIVNN